MNDLQERVTVVTPTEELHGELGIDPFDGLPILYVRSRSVVTPPFPAYEAYRPWTVPAAWIITDAQDERIEGPLLDAWRDVDRIRQAIQIAQRAAEGGANRD